MSAQLNRFSANELLSIIGKLESGAAAEVIEDLIGSGFDPKAAAHLVASFQDGDTHLFFDKMASQVYDAASQISLRGKLEEIDIPGYSEFEPLASTLLSDLFKATRALEGGDKQEVVIKIYKESGKSERLSLFEQERYVLARINHPNTLRLLDTGVCRYGPFLVTEYLDARSLDQWVDENSFDLTTCSRIVLQILEATEYLHSRLLLHRDIKASNVMVAENAQVKLIDYGISGEMSLESSGAATLLGAMSYLTASPEQLEGNSADVRSDVYQLGMLICFVHTGGHPFPGTSSPTQLHDDKHFERFDFQQLLAVSGRSIDARLQPILEKAMRWRQQDRYLSVAELKEDYQRYLEWREPRYAQKSPGLNLRLFIRRHMKWLLPLGVAVAATLIFSTFIYSQYRHIKTISDDLSSSLAASNMVTEVFFDALRETNPDIASQESGMNTNRRAARASRITRSALQRYTSRVRPDTALDVKVRLGLIQAFTELGLSTTALELVEGMPLDRYRGRIKHELYAELVLAWLAAQVEIGDVIAAQQLALELSGFDLSNQQAIELAIYEIRLAQHNGDEESLLEAVKRGEVFVGQKEIPTAIVSYFYRTAAEVMGSFAKFPEAEALYSLAERTMDRLNVAKDTGRRRSVQAGLGNILLDQGKYKPALSLFESLLEIEKKVYVEPHPNLAATYNNLARAQLRSNQTESALANMAESVRLYEQSLGSKHTRYLTGRFNYAATLLSTGQAEAAIEIFKTNTAAYAAIQPDSLAESISGLKLAEAYLAMNDHEKSMTYFAKYLPVLIETLGEEHPRVAVNRCRYARALSAVGKPKLAIEVKETAMPVMLKTFGDDHPLLLECSLSSLG